MGMPWRWHYWCWHWLSTGAGQGVYKGHGAGTGAVTDGGSPCAGAVRDVAISWRVTICLQPAHSEDSTVTAAAAAAATVDVALQRIVEPMRPERLGCR
jgi:hypothetical protein